MPKFDPAKFNADPKHQEERDFLDAIVLESAKRIRAKIDKEKPADDGGLGGFFDFLKGE
jgi:hypothetical protein